MPFKTIRGGILLLALATGVRVDGQSPPDPNAFRNGVVYTFERVLATRTVNDAYDRGPIYLATYIWRPISSTRHEVVLYSHGSLGGMSIDPREPEVHIPAELLEFLVRRGYTVVAPTRRGIGASTGTFREECEFSAGKCSLADYRALMEPGVAEAVRDTNAVIEQVIEGKEVPNGTRIILAGVSRGGFLALRMAAERPDITKGVLAFVPGWLSLNEAWPAEEVAARVELQGRAFRDIGAKARSPTLWINAARDPFYSEAATRQFFAAFEAGGGPGRYLFVPEHQLRTGHLVATEPPLWEQHVSAFLDGLR